VGGVLFPDERVAGDGVEGVEVVCTERPRLDEAAFQDGLEVEWDRERIAVVP
jgi:hypothetical protein